MKKANAAILSANTVLSAKSTTMSTRYCGRYLQTSAAAYAANSICCKYNMPPDFLRNCISFIIVSYNWNHIVLTNSSFAALAVPFELGVDFNDDEFCTAVTAGNTCEHASGSSSSTTGGGGILGFSLCYTQTVVGS